MLVTLSRAASNLLRADESAAIVEDVIDSFDDIVGTSEHVELLLRVANVRWIEDDNAGAIAWADKALIEAELHDVVPAIVNAMITKGGALGYSGRGYEGISTMRGAYSLAEAHGIQDGMLRAQTNLSDALISRDPRAALETARAALEAVRRLGRLDYLVVLTLNATYPAFRTGDWDFAVAEAASLQATALSEVDHAAGLLGALPIAASRGEDVADRAARAAEVMGSGTDNQATATVEVGPFTPPVTPCVAVSKVTPKQLFVGRKMTLKIHVSQGGKAVKGVHVRIKGPKVNIRTKASNSKGLIKRTIKMKKAGVLVFTPIASKACNTKRVGVTNVFTPPVTG
jgi:hypothetical protein